MGGRSEWFLTSLAALVAAARGVTQGADPAPALEVAVDPGHAVDHAQGHPAGVGQGHELPGQGLALLKNQSPEHQGSLPPGHGQGLPQRSGQNLVPSLIQSQDPNLVHLPSHHNQMGREMHKMLST